MQKKLTILFIILSLVGLIWAQPSLRVNTDLYFSEILINGEEQPLIKAGDTLWFTIRIDNRGAVPFGNCNLTVHCADPYVTFIDSTEYFDYIAPGNSYLLHDCIGCVVNPLTSSNHILNFFFNIQNNDETATCYRTYQTKTFDLKVLDYSISDNGNHNQLINQNETADITFAMENISGMDLRNFSFSLETNEPGISVVSDYFHKDIIYADEVFNYTVQIQADQSFTDGRTFDVTISPSSPDLGISHSIVSIVGTDNCIDFEGGIIPSEMYGESSQVGWYIDSNIAYTGFCSLRSGEISHYDSSSVSLPVTLDHNDVVSFFFKTSTENNYDWLYFYVDNVQLERWSGTNDWTRYQVNLAPGTHILTWRYIKDKSVNSGSDCVWIDHISIPTNEDISFSLGPDSVYAEIEQNSGCILQVLQLFNESDRYILYENILSDLQGNLIGWAKMNSPHNGSVNAHEQVNLDLLIDPHNYPLGNYEAVLSVIINGADTIRIPIYLQHISGTGILEHQVKNDIFVYPNPTSGTVHIDNHDNLIESLVIYDMHGRSIPTNISTIDETITVDLSHLPSGCYFLRTRHKNGGQAVQRVIRL